MKNCIYVYVYFFLSEVIHPCGSVIWYLSELWIFLGDIFELKNPFSMSEFAHLKNSYIYVYMFF